MRHTSTRGFWSKKNSLILVQIAWQFFQRSTWNVLPRVTTSWGLKTLRLNIIPKLFDRNTSQWNGRFLCRKRQQTPPTWAIMKDLARCTQSEHLNVKMASKIKIMAHPAHHYFYDRQLIKLPIIENSRWVKTANILSHHISPSQRIDIWQPTDREDMMPSWTEPTLDQLIIRFNAMKSSNYFTLKWNNRIYLTSNLVETNTPGSTLHSTIRTQLSKIGRSTDRHFYTQACRCPNPTQISRPKAYKSHKLWISRSRLWAWAAAILNLT